MNCKSWRGYWAVLVVLACAGSASAQSHEAILENLFLPELVRQTHEALGLTEEQKTSLVAEHEKAQAQVAALQEKLQAETAALLEIVKKEKIDEAAAIAHGLKVAEVDRDIKKAQFTLLIRIKNALTPEQQTKLKNLRARHASIQTKMAKALELAQQWRDQGKDLSALEQERDKFESLMKEGKFEEAEAILNEAIKTLGGDAKK